MSVKKIKSIKSILFCLFFILFVLVILFPFSKASAYGDGWMALVSNEIGNDSSCGVGYVKQELVIRDLVTGNPVNPSLARFSSRRLSDGVVYNTSAGSSSIIGPICYNPDLHSLETLIDGGFSYYDFMSSDAWIDPGIVVRGKYMRTTVWLHPRSKPVDYRHISPVGVFTNINPNYAIEINDFPNNFGASEFSHVIFYVNDFFSGANVVNTTISLSGGNGIKTLPVQSLIDGVYNWNYYLRLNGSNIWTSSINSSSHVSSFPFLLDRVPPNILTVSHVPANPATGNSVTITGNADENLSGINRIEVYLDSVLVKTCPFFLVYSASCQAIVGPFAAAGNHTYYIKAYDSAGNVATSAIQSFTVSGACVPLCDQDATHCIGDPYEGGCGMGNACWGGTMACCTPNCNCDVNTCIGETCTDSCGNVGACPGKKNCSWREVEP